MNRYGLFMLLASWAVSFGSGWAASQPASVAALPSAVQQALYTIETAPGGFAAANPAQHLSAHFAAAAVRLETKAGAVGLELAGYGYGERLAPPEAAHLTAAGTRIEYRRGPLTEWYVNESRGLEQGFTFASAPGRAEPGERLTIALTVTGGMQPVLAPAGDAVLLESGGRAQLRYTGLRAWDANGRDLDARFSVGGREVRLTVDDTAAAYPITVDPWTLDAQLVAQDAAAGDTFGISVAASGNTILVGASSKNGSTGAAYVFVMTGGVWAQQAKLTGSDAGQLCFGNSVALSGDTAVIGAPCIQRAYVFTRSGTTWTQAADFQPTDVAAGDDFGQTVALGGNTILVASPFKAINGATAQGAVYVFTNSGGAWSQQAELLATDGSANADFGNSLAVSDSGTIAIIGAPGASAVYSFMLSGTWFQQYKMTPSDSAPSFGAAVSKPYLEASGNFSLLIGAYQSSGPPRVSRAGSTCFGARRASGTRRTSFRQTTASVSTGSAARSRTTTYSTTPETQFRARLR